MILTVVVVTVTVDIAVVNAVFVTVPVLTNTTVVERPSATVTVLPIVLQVISSCTSHTTLRLNIRDLFRSGSGRQRCSHGGEVGWSSSCDSLGRYWEL